MSKGNRMMKSLEIPKEEFEFLRKLNQGEVRYLLIGGYAMKYFGCVRRTEDIDLLIDNVIDNAQMRIPVKTAT